MIGSYFMALSLSFVDGMDQAAIFRPFMLDPVADLFGSTLLLLISLVFMVGVQLRLSALALTLFVLSSSIVQNLVNFEMANLSGFWRDLALVGGIMLNYTHLRAMDLRAASIVAQRIQPRRVIINETQRKRLQRDISHALSTGRHDLPERAMAHLRALDAAADEVPTEDDTATPVRRKAGPTNENRRESPAEFDAMEFENMDNIFSVS